jgi:hypothetical protein
VYKRWKEGDLKDSETKKLIYDSMEDENDHKKIYSILIFIV